MQTEDAQRGRFISRYGIIHFNEPPSTVSSLRVYCLYAGELTTQFGLLLMSPHGSLPVCTLRAKSLKTLRQKKHQSNSANSKNGVVSWSCKKNAKLVYPSFHAETLAGTSHFRHLSQPLTLHFLICVPFDTGEVGIQLVTMRPSRLSHPLPLRRPLVGLLRFHLDG